MWNGEIKSQKFRWAWRANNGRLLNEAAAAGQGIIQAPSYSVKDYALAKRLTEVLPEHSINELTVYAVYPHRYELSTKIKAFVEMAKDYFEKHSLP